MTQALRGIFIYRPSHRRGILILVCCATAHYLAPTGGRASRRRTNAVGTLATALIALFVAVAPAEAQLPALHVTGRAGLGIPSDDYQADCGFVSAAYSVDLQGRGRLFPHLSLDHFAGSGGASVACIPVNPSVGTARGGLQVDGATRVGIGAGARVGGPRLLLEGLVSGGVMSGRYGFKAPSAADDRTTVPQVGGQVALVVYRYVVLSIAAHWTRLSLTVTPVVGSAVNTTRSWSPMSTLQVGARVPLARR
jgi:hypothetical protein